VSSVLDANDANSVAVVDRVVNRHGDRVGGAGSRHGVVRQVGGLHHHDGVHLMRK